VVSETFFQRLESKVENWGFLFKIMKWDRYVTCLTILLLAGNLIACTSLPDDELAAATQSSQAASNAAQFPNDVVIENESDLAPTYPGASYELHFTARGGVPTLHWRLEKGTLPPGLKLEDAGLLHGQPQSTGEFQFTLSVTDSDKPPQAVQKQFMLRVRSALTLLWKSPVRVNTNRIDGSVEVENTTPDDVDLTFVVLAVARNGRATAIGYQHFLLRRGVSKELPFGDTLPNGGYIVHVDAVGEVPKRNLIYRERLQTDALQVTVGP